MKVRLIAHNPDGLECVLLEYLDGSHQIVDIASWRCLDLYIHSLPALPAPRVEHDIP